MTTIAEKSQTFLCFLPYNWSWFCFPLVILLTNLLGGLRTLRSFHFYTLFFFSKITHTQRNNTNYIWICCVREHTFLNNMDRLSKFGCWLRFPGSWTLKIYFEMSCCCPSSVNRFLLRGELESFILYICPLGSLELNGSRRASCVLDFFTSFCFGEKK